MPTTISGNTGVSQVQAGSITAADLDGAQTGSAPIYGCRAWVNFDGTKDTTGATSTSNTNRLILGSGNVTSVLRNATGDYTVTFTTAMPDANYMLVANGVRGTEVVGFVSGYSVATRLTTSIRLVTSNSTPGSGGAVSTIDYPIMDIAVFR